MELREVLAKSDDLRRPPWRGDPNPVAGHCYVACEALYHMAGGARSGLRPHTVRVNGIVHWYLRDADGSVVDPTSDQFDESVPYERGRGRGFLTSKPSKRAQELIRRVRKA